MAFKNAGFVADLGTVRCHARLALQRSSSSFPMARCDNNPPRPGLRPLRVARCGCSCFYSPGCAAGMCARDGPGFLRLGFACLHEQRCGGGDIGGLLQDTVSVIANISRRPNDFLECPQKRSDLKGSMRQGRSAICCMRLERVMHFYLPFKGGLDRPYRAGGSLGTLFLGLHPRLSYYAPLGLGNNASSKCMTRSKHEKPYFEPLIKRDHLESVVCVKPKMDNPRIIRQDGAFFFIPGVSGCM